LWVRSSKRERGGRLYNPGTYFGVVNGRWISVACDNGAFATTSGRSGAPLTLLTLTLVIVSLLPFGLCLVIVVVLFGYTLCLLILFIY
jgi:hypothetical protein